jgi:hypothetical protein
MISRRLTLVPLSVAASACIAAAPLHADENASLDPVAFFTGASQGEATLKVIASGPKRVSVRSHGRSDGRGGLILVQHIREGDKPERVRTWTMRPIGTRRYTGTLTPDAEGAVAVDASGPRAQIRYRMKSGLHVRQELALQADGVTLLNRLSVTKWGMQVARLDEVIRKTP